MHFEEEFGSFRAYLADYSLRNQFPHKSGSSSDSMRPRKYVLRKIRVLFPALGEHKLNRWIVFSHIFCTIATLPYPPYFSC